MSSTWHNVRYLVCHMKHRQYAKRTDHNQKEIIYGLRRAGCETEPITGCSGMCDLLVAFRGRLFLLEIKNPETKGKVNEWQIAFHKRYPVSVVHSLEEALVAVGLKNDHS